MADLLLNWVHTLGNGVLGYAVPFLFVLTLVVFFHELGHFLVARWNGVRVLTFSLGFGPEIVGFNDRHGTRWKLSLIPLGGYVKFFGDESEASTPSSDSLAKMTAAEQAVSFHHKRVGPRAAIVVAGPVANFLLAIVLFTFLFSVFGVPNTSARVDGVQPGSAAESAGFQPGDVVVAIDGKQIRNFLEMQRLVGVEAGHELKFTIKRGDSTLDLAATPQLKEIKDRFGNVQRLGLLGISRTTAANEALTERVDPATALWMGIKETWFVVDRTFAYIGGVFTGREAADQLGGPLRIAQVSGQVATIGFTPLLHLAAVLSISIGLLNLFPVPLLDGGHLLFYAVEAVRGRPLSERAQEMGFRIGLGLVLMLMVFATYNDILHFASS